MGDKVGETASYSVLPERWGRSQARGSNLDPDVSQRKLPGDEVAHTYFGASADPRLGSDVLHSSFW